MGECGCANFLPDHKVDGADGAVYAVELHAGCLYCDTPVGVVVTKLAGTAIAQWDAQDLPPLPLNENSEYVAEVLHPRDVITAMLEESGNPETAEGDTLRELLEEFLPQAILEAVSKAKTRNRERWESAAVQAQDPSDGVYSVSEDGVDWRPGPGWSCHRFVHFVLGNKIAGDQKARARFQVEARMVLEELADRLGYGPGDYTIAAYPGAFCFSGYVTMAVAGILINFERDHMSTLPPHFTFAGLYPGSTYPHTQVEYQDLADDLDQVVARLKAAIEYRPRRT